MTFERARFERSERAKTHPERGAAQGRRSVFTQGYAEQAIGPINPSPPNRRLRSWNNPSYRLKAIGVFL